MKYNGFDIPDNEVDKMVDALEISLAEACELWLADHDKMVNEEQEKANKLAETAPRRYEQGALPRKKTKKERKVNKNKGDLLKTMAIALIEKHNCTEMEQKTETELHFEYKNKRYTVKLTEHRPQK